MSTDIRRARDVIAKWRDSATPGQWEDYGAYIAVPGYVVANGTARDVPLIVGTAGNPDLLDAIDKMLASADRSAPTTEWGDHGLRIAGQRIAAAIIAADERMRS